jgi:hypothetical protein
MSQCSSNPCELRETQKPHVHVFGFDPMSNPMAPVLGNWWHQFCVSGPNGQLFEISVAPSLGTRWHRFPR